MLTTLLMNRLTFYGRKYLKSTAFLHGLYIKVSLKQPTFLIYPSHWYKNDVGPVQPRKHLRLVVNFALPSTVLAGHCSWSNNVRLYWIIYLSSLSPHNSILLFRYNPTLNVFGVSHFAESLIMPKGDTETRPDHLSSLEMCMRCPLLAVFQIR